ncbi:MAG: hypothetical protein L3J06_09180 [Cyclobacteriaceae bacterium]|nr:hypothetical protein [Cyclobacteriaceae bacterium]
MMRLVFVPLFFVPFLATAQVDDGSNDEIFTISTPITIDLGKEEEVYEKKKKKKKKKVYYGIKTKKGFARKGVGTKTTLELFNTLKTPQTPNAYVRDIYYYDFERKQIRKTRKYDPRKGVLLHGPYKKKLGDITIEEGIFYVGTKHGRWVRKDKNDILIDKEKYYKGWPKESLVRYYDKERRKIKEIIPVEYGVKEGNYFYFSSTGVIAIAGEFRYGNKVGKWSAFYTNRRGRKSREIQYRKDPFNDNFKPYILREWNTKGKQIYDYAKDKKRPQ